MTKRYPFRGLLCRRDSRDPRHFQRIPFRVFQPPDGVHNTRLHLHKTLRRRRSCRHRFLRHVHHPHFAFLSVMRQLCHVRAPRRYPFSVTRRHSRRSQFFRVPLALSGSNSPSLTPRYHPTLATSAPSLPAFGRSTPRTRAKNASAPSFPSMPPPVAPPPAEALKEKTGLTHLMPPPVAPPPAATRAPALRPTNQSPAPQIVRTSPSLKRDSPATRTPACPGTFRTPPASPAGSPPHRRRIPRPWLLARSQRGRTFPSRRRPIARAHLLSARTRFSLPNPRYGPPHSPEPPARRPQFEPARPARRCCCFESETRPVFHQSRLPRPPWKESPRVDAARIAVAPHPLVPPAPAPRIRAACPWSKWSAQLPPRFPLAQCSARGSEAAAAQ